MQLLTLTLQVTVNHLICLPGPRSMPVSGLAAFVLPEGLVANCYTLWMGSIQCSWGEGF